MKVLAIIPARSGSKSVKDKNIRTVAGKPMLAWSVEHALASSLIDRVIVSTDSESYAEIARSYGAEVPFIRPEEYATDTALDIDVFAHALKWLADNENYYPDLVVQLRPTYPKRDPVMIDSMINILANTPEADSIRSVADATEVPYKMWLTEAQTEQRAQTGAQTEQGLQPGAQTEQGPQAGTQAEPETGNPQAAEYGCALGRIYPLIRDIPECYNMPRQELPHVYYQNACVDVTRAEVILEKHSMTGSRILGYLMKDNLDIDTENELLKAEIELLKAENEMLKAEIARTKD